MVKSIKFRNKRTFISAGWGRYGPYAVAGIRGKRSHVWASVGTRGKRFGFGYKKLKFKF